MQIRQGNIMKHDQLARHQLGLSSMILNGLYGH